MSIHNSRLPPTQRLTVWRAGVFLFSFLFFILLHSCRDDRSRQETEPVLNELIEREWAFRLKEFPQLATYYGKSSQNYRLGSITQEDIERRQLFYTSLVDELQAIDPGQLANQDQINHGLLLYHAKNELSYYGFREYRMPLTADDGFHTSLAQLPSYTRFQTVRDYEDYITRLHEIPEYINQHIFWMRQGLADGFTMPRVVLEGYEVTITSHLVDDVTRSVFYSPFLRMPDSFSEETVLQLQELGAEAIRESVVAGYENLLTFFIDEYRPGCRETISASALPDGDEFYKSKVRYFTTTELSVDQVHELGLTEVERIGKEMDNEIEKSGFKGDRAAFIQFLRSDPRFYPATADELLMEASYIAKKMDGKLPLLFGKLPRQPYSVAPVPDHLAPKYTAGRYSPAPVNSTSPGYYWVNTYNLPSRSLYNMEALTLHEAVPGHHLQIALTQELDSLPEFRQHLYVDAFGEGWGLYAEWLGIEAGFYQDPYSAFGRLTYEMWRACRLVVDTGIHSKGWTRRQVIDYLAEHTALSLHECTTETDRYISWPGQALAYKVGELKIKTLRQRAANELGEKFNVREFHDRVLSQGTVTLPILERMITEFIDDKKQADL